MNFLSSHPSVGGTVGWDGLQLQARTRHSPWVGTMFAPLHTGFMSLHCSRWRHGIRAGYGIRGVRPGYTIALGTEKVQTEVQKQSEGSGNRG